MTKWHKEHARNLALLDKAAAAAVGSSAAHAPLPQLSLDADVEVWARTFPGAYCSDRRIGGGRRHLQRAIGTLVRMHGQRVRAALGSGSTVTFSGVGDGEDEHMRTVRLQNNGGEQVGSVSAQ